jgi:hypothetical protein
MKMEQTKCSEKSAYKIQTPWNYPKERIQHSEQGESLKSRIILRQALYMHTRLTMKSVFVIIETGDSEPPETNLL